MANSSCSLKNTKFKCSEGGQIKEASKFSEKHLRLIQRRSEVVDQLQLICLNHERQFLTFYEQKQTTCCDPFGRHKNPVKTNLWTINDNFDQHYNADYPVVMEGKKLCSNCRHLMLNPSNVEEEVAEEEENAESVREGEQFEALDGPRNSDLSNPASGSEVSVGFNTPPDFLLEQINESLSKLGFETIKMKSLLLKTYRKKKLEEIKNMFESLFDRIVGIETSTKTDHIRNRKVAEESFYSVGSWTVENRNLEASGQSNSSNNSSESNSSPSASNEILAQPGSSQIDVKPSGSRLLADENTNSSETDRTLNEGSLLTINVMSPKNDPQSSSILLNPSVFLNVCPRKRKYATELSSNNGFSASEVKEETNDENQESNYSNINNLKYPIVVSERLPALFTETLTINAGGNVPPKEPQLNSSKDGKTEIRKRSKPSLRSRSTRSADGSSKHTKNDSFDNRRSVRSRKAISYKE